MKLIGLVRQGNDATIRYTPGGDAVANLSLAFNYGKKDEGTGQRPTTWVDASLWGKRAEALEQYLTKGRQWYVEISEVHIETYEGRNGQGHKLVGRVDNIEFTGGGEQQQPATQQRQSAQQQRSPNPGETRNEYAAATGKAQPQRQQAQPAQRPAADFSDMEDSDIPW